TRCYVMRVASEDDLKDPSALKPLEAIDEISLVAAPGSNDAAVWNNVLSHCKNTNRFAILDEGNPDQQSNGSHKDQGQTKTQPATLPINSPYGAFYYPRIRVFDPATKSVNPASSGLIHIGACGHLAGIYARVDAERGVHKAPANEGVQGAVGLEV